MQDDTPPYSDADAPPDDDAPAAPNVHHLPAAPARPPTPEQALLGAIFLEPALAARLRDHIDAGDFDEPKHETIWHAIHTVAETNHTLPDPLLVSEHLRTTGQLTKVGGAPYLFTLAQLCPSTGNAEHYATQVRNQARIRHAGHAINRAKQFLTTATPDAIDHALGDTLQTLDDVVARVGPRHTALIRVPTIDELLHGDDDEDQFDWVIPGLIEHQERVILTAEEGAGKSTLLRQIAVTAAAGIHPFSNQPIDPVRVLHVDVENSIRQSRRQYRPIRIQAGDSLDPDRLRIEIRVAGIDLTTREDQDWLQRTVDSVTPDLLLIGPIYKLANGDPTEEQSAKPVAMALDRIRDTTDCAILLEAHAAKAPTGQRRRPHEPYGWSGWLRWPEVGLWLDKDGDLTPWRGAREEREWPRELERGGTWPWTPSQSGPDGQWLTLQKARVDAGKPLSLRELEKATGLSRSAISRLVGKGGRYEHGWIGFNETRRMGDKVT